MKAPILQILKFIFCTAAYLAASAAYPCTAPSATNLNHQIDWAGIIIDPSAAHLGDAIATGYEKWNESDCVDPRLAPYPFPHFAEANGADTNITIRLQQGTRAGSTIPTCAEIVGGGSHFTVTLYSQANYSEGIVNCDMSPSTIADTIAHEMGHFLGLNDAGQDCGFIMGPKETFISGGTAWDTTSPPRTVTAVECSQANAVNSTPYEEYEQGCEWDESCSPDFPCGHGCGSPVVIDLDRNDFHFSGSYVQFDIDDDSEMDWITWTNPDEIDAFLCRDRNGNGLIDDGSELFGDATPMLAGHTADHGYIALLELDETGEGNRDRKLSPEDGSGWSSLCAWIDGNQNAVSEPDELFSLEDVGILEIDLDFRSSRRIDAYGNELRYFSTAKILWEGKVRTTKTTDVYFVKIVD